MSNDIPKGRYDENGRPIDKGKYYHHKSRFENKSSKTYSYKQRELNKEQELFEDMQEAMNDKYDKLDKKNKNNNFKFETKDEFEDSVRRLFNEDKRFLLPVILIVILVPYLGLGLIFYYLYLIGRDK